MVNVVKANGETELFSEEKVLASIARSGIPEQLHPFVLKHIKERLHENIPSQEIYKHIAEFLEKTEEPFSKSKYMLKQAIMQLGPTGYPFEDFVAKVLQKMDYTTKTRTIMQGKCISHEIDVIAEKNTVIPTKILIEAKFHNQVGLRTNVHVPMYTKSRFEDVKEKHGFSEVWLVTNTKATVDAIAYAACVGMKIITWSYPEKSGLRDLIEKFHLYPVTALTTLSDEHKQQLLTQGIVLASDICAEHSLLNQLSLPSQKREEILKEVSFVCNSNS